MSAHAIPLATFGRLLTLGVLVCGITACGPPGEEGEEAEEAGEEPVAGAPEVAVQGGTDDCQLFFDNTNINLVQNGAPKPTFTVTGQDPSELCGLYTYHWNGGQGKLPGTIGLRNLTTGQLYGPYNATPTPGQGGAPNVNWTVLLSPRIEIRPGEYEVVDSDPTTWSWNAASQNSGFAKVWLKDAI